VPIKLGKFSHCNETTSVCNSPREDFVFSDFREGPNKGNGIDEIFCLAHPAEILPREAIRVAKKAVIIGQHMATRLQGMAKSIFQVLLFE
jgi:hypothetical protein